MSLLIHIVIVVVIVGLLLWVVQSFPMPLPFQRLLYAVIVIGVLLWVVQELGFLGGFNRRRGALDREPHPAMVSALLPPLG
jgi:hypothetical protein